MIYGLTGELKQAGLNYVVLNVGGVEYRISIPINQEKQLKVGEKIHIFTHLNVREGGADLYGFLSEEILELFELLISVSGVGPKSAMAILSVAPVQNIKASIAGGEPDLLRRSSGVGRKTAERIIVELRDKVGPMGSGDTAKWAESDQDVYEALVSLGYQRRKIEDALREINPDVTDVRDRLKEALKKIKG
ncbi:MAG: Holliday junction branch migration protein RuvA [Candidatus Colwellbacteria bacterium]|nr:Holliday junction branch migration protein RuvA [Candidatus Colwellbacteria bacterium]